MCILINVGKAQDTLQHSDYIARVYGFDAKQINKGFITAIKDSSIVISQFSNMNELLEIPYYKMYKLKLRRKNSIIRSMTKDAVIGVGVGALLGFVFGNISSSEAAAIGLLGGGVIFGIGGAIIGTLGGTLSVVLPINGKKDMYLKHKQTIEKYATPTIRTKTKWHLNF